MSWQWSYGSWIYNYLCNQYLSPLMLWVRISIRVRCTTLCDKVCQWLATDRWFSLGPPVYTYKTGCHNLTEILLEWKWRKHHKARGKAIIWHSMSICYLYFHILIFFYKIAQPNGSKLAIVLMKLSLPGNVNMQSYKWHRFYWVQVLGHRFNRC
jgi:hypothetical protein